MREVFVSTGAFVGRPNGRDHRLIPLLAKNIVCDGFELMFYKDWYDNADGIGGFLKSSGRPFTAKRASASFWQKRILTRHSGFLR